MSLGQVGEFSFVLIALGLSVGAINNEAYRMLLAVIALSLIISPLWLDSARRIQRLAVHVDNLHDLMERLYPRATASAVQGLIWAGEKKQALARRHQKAPPEVRVEDTPTSGPADPANASDTDPADDAAKS